MKRAALALLLGLLAAISGAQGFSIKEFAVQLRLEKNGVLHVQEDIQTVFSEQRHGIFRDLPVSYETGKGVTRSLKITNIRVTDEGGRSRPTKISKHGNYLNIRIGDADAHEPVGQPVTYVISYDSFGQM